MVSAKVFDVMRLLAKFRFVPTDVIQQECFPNSTEHSREEMTSRVLRQLRAHGLVESQVILGRTAVHWLTEEGAKGNDVEGGRHVGVRLAEYEHDLAIIQLWLKLKKNPIVETIITEREARSEGLDPEENDWAIPIVRQSGKPGYAWPDLITIGSNGRWGHEVEWTQKGKQRLRLLMLAYGHDARYSGGLYYTTDASRNVIEEAAEIVNQRLAESGYGRQIITKDLNDAIGDVS